MKSNLFFYLPIGTLIISLVLIGYFVVYKNILIKDVVFSYSALCAALVMFLLNIGFSMKQQHERKVIESSFIMRENIISIDKSNLGFKDTSSFINRNKDKIPKKLKIPSVEEIINKDSLENRNIIKEKLNHYFIISTLGIISEEFHKWKWITNDEISLVRKTGNFSSIDSSFYSENELRKMIFKKTGFNDFNSINVYKGIFIPKNTKLTIENDAITFENEFIHLKISVFFNMNYNTHKIVNGEIKPFCELREHNFIFWPFTIKYATIYKRENIGNPKLAEIKKWEESIHYLLSIRYSV